MTAHVLACRPLGACGLDPSSGVSGGGMVLAGCLDRHEPCTTAPEPCNGGFPAPRPVDASSTATACFLSDVVVADQAEAVSSGRSARSRGSLSAGKTEAPILGVDGGLVLRPIEAPGALDVPLLPRCRSSVSSPRAEPRRDQGWSSSVPRCEGRTPALGRGLTLRRPQRYLVVRRRRRSRKGSRLRNLCHDRFMPLHSK